MTRRRWLVGAGAVVVSSALIWGYAAVESPSHWLGWFALSPFIAALLSTASARSAGLLGGAMAIGYTVASQGWFAESVARYTGAPVSIAFAALLLAAPLLQPQFVTAALALHAVRSGQRTASPVLQAGAFCFAYLGTEWLWPKLFADTLGLGLQPSTVLRQAAELGGAPLLTFVLLAVSFTVAAAAQALTSRTSLRAIGPLAATAVVLVASISAFGSWRRRQLEADAATGRTVRLGIVQANITRYGELAERMGTYDAVRFILDTHYAMSERLLSAGQLDAVVWPETVYPTTYGSPQSPEGEELDEEIRQRVARWGVPLVFGAYDREGGHEFNAAMVVDPRAPAELTSYRKTHLFPLTEWVPPALESAAFRAAFPWAGTWTPGAGPRLVALGTVRAAPLICYDLLSAEYVASAAALAPELLLALSNDAWFGGTRGARLHLAVSALRSVETRLPQFRATNSGISAAIDALGEIRARTEDGRPEALVAELTVPATPRDTLAMRWGAWVGPSSLLLLGAVFGARFLRPRGG